MVPADPQLVLPKYSQMAWSSPRKPYVASGGAMSYQVVLRWCSQKRSLLVYSSHR